MKQLLALLLLVGITGCLPQGQAKPTSRIPALPTGNSGRQASPVAAAGSSADPASLPMDQALYWEECAGCHFAAGEAPELRLSDLEALSSSELYDLLMGPASNHPRIAAPIDQLTPSQLQTMLQQLAAGAVATPSGEGQNCSDCHWDGRSGQGHD